MPLITEPIRLLKTLIGTPSFSREEAGSARVLAEWFSRHNIPIKHQGHNIWVKAKYWHNDQPTILLNSHHDTVRPVAGWTRDPFQPTIDGDKLYGLGSNDAGASLVALIATFFHFYDQADLPFNLLLAATAEEEISGPNGIASILALLGEIHLGIVGEPTEMQLAIAEKGLMVIDAEAKGRSGHAARTEGINAIYLALKDIEQIRSLQFTKVSSLLGKTKATVTQIQAGTQHNVIPDSCRYVIDVRTNEEYSNQEAFALIQQGIQSTLRARSFRLNSSKISDQHPFIQVGRQMGLTCFGSPTLSDQALMPFDTVKIGVGKSKRSHTADEYVRLSEIESGIEIYKNLLQNYACSISNSTSHFTDQN